MCVCGQSVWLSCVSKLCVSKLCEDKLCVDKLCVDKCVEHAQNEASCRGHGNWLRATVHVVVASPPGFLRALLGPWHAPSYRCWARGCNCTTYTTTYVCIYANMLQACAVCECQSVCMHICVCVHERASLGRYACMYASMHVLVSASMYMSRCIRLQACWQMQLCSCAMCMHVGV